MGAERPNENGRLTERCRRCRLQLFMSLPTQAEESFMGAERPNENGRLTERCRRCRLNAESGWGADGCRRQKEYAPQKRNMQKRKRPANTGGMCNCEVKRQPGTGFCGGKKKKPDVMSGFFTS